MSQSLAVNFRSLNEADFTLNLSINDTIRMVKDQIHSHKGIEQSKQRLIYHGQLLEDSKPLNSYRIQDGHTVHLMKRVIRPPSTTSDAPPAVSVDAPRPRNRILMATQLVLPQQAISDALHRR